MRKCRACLQKEADSYCSIYKKIQKVTLEEMFHSLTGLSVSREDGLPLCFCQECADFIVTCNNFRKKCIKSDAHLRAAKIISEEAQNEIPKVDYFPTAGKISEDDYEIEPENDVTEKTYYEEEAKPTTQRLVTTSTELENHEESDYDLYDVVEDVGIVENVASDYNESGVSLEGDIEATDSRENSPKTADGMDEAAPEDNPMVCLIISCCGCSGSQFTSVKDLKQHRLEVHKKKNISNSLKIHHCDICFEPFCKNIKLLKEEAALEAKERYVCTICGASYSSRAALQSHNNSKHLRKRKYACDVCQKAFYTSSTLISHRQTHGKKKYQCTVCSKMFLRRWDMLSHQNTHSNERPYGCSVCDMRFKSSAHLRGHQSVHTGERSKKCRKCGKGFRTYSDRRVHELEHENIHPFKCDFCDKKYGRNYKLQVHIRMVHTGEQPFACTDCSKRFFQRWELTAHRRTDHGDVEG
ncbi:zinc finger protein 567-like [Anopheles funestus]|uniref:zinc finger protein 567-like n=1 Tax=Anopheles funestus TaxID=62324 RepID=UPI0020C64EEE|nr:zinc finger protein 567-like [Anopheles funestus]